MEKNNLWVVRASLAIAFVFSSYVQGVIIDDVSDDFSAAWAYSVPASTGTVSATATFDITSISVSQLVMAITIENTTTLGDLGNAGLASFGFNINADATGASIAGGSIFDSTGVQQNLPSIDNNIDVCIWAANNCQGGAQGNLLAAGDSDSFTLTLNFANNYLASFDLDTFGVKFQTGKGSFELEGCVSTDPNCNTTVPEPGALALLGLGITGLGLARRRYRLVSHY